VVVRVVTIRAPPPDYASSTTKVRFARETRVRVSTRTLQVASRTVTGAQDAVVVRLNWPRRLPTASDSRRWIRTVGVGPHSQLGVGPPPPPARPPPAGPLLPGPRRTPKDARIGLGVVPFAREVGNRATRRVSPWTEPHRKNQNREPIWRSLLRPEEWVKLQSTW
jgi:hypothetical protein